MPDPVHTAAHTTSACVAALLIAACASPSRDDAARPESTTASASQAGQPLAVATAAGGARDTTRLDATSSFRAWFDSSQQCRQYRTVNNHYTQELGWVLLETTDVTWCPTAEGARESSVTITRWQNDSVGLAPRYSVSAAGERGRRIDNVYEVRERTSGGGDDQYTYFSLETGARVFEGRAPAIRLSLNRAPWRRFLALTPERLQYGDGERPSTGVRIDGLDGVEYCVRQFGFVRPGEEQLADSLVVWSRDSPSRATPVPQFTVRAKLSPCSDDGKEGWFEVSVVNDALDLAHARVSPGLSLVP